DQHRARAALAAVAADVRAGEVEMVAQQLGESPAIFDFEAMGCAVYGDADGCVGDTRVGGGLRRRLRFGDRGGRRGDDSDAGALEKFAAGGLVFLLLAHENPPRRFYMIRRAGGRAGAAAIQKLQNEPNSRPARIEEASTSQNSGS